MTVLGELVSTGALTPRNPHAPLLVAAYPRPHKHIRGVYAPGVGAVAGDARTPTSDWREKPYSPANTRGVLADGRVMKLEDALRTRWDSHTHIVAYVVHGPDGLPLEHQPRVNKTGSPSGVDWMRAEGYQLYCRVLIADVDIRDPKTGQKTLWTDELRAEWNTRIRRSKTMNTAGLFMSKRGLKLFQPLTVALTPEELEPVLRTWLVTLISEGIEVDMACIDWTRFFCAPNVIREGERFDGGLIVHREEIPPPVPNDLNAFKSFEDAVDGTGGGHSPQPSKPSRAKRPKSLRKPSALPARYEDVPPESWIEKIDQIADAIRNDATPGTYHELSKWLAGSLLLGERGNKLEPEFVPVVVAECLVRGGARDREHHLQNAISTCERHASGVEIAGFSRLGKEFDGVSQCVSYVLAQGRRAAIIAETSSIPKDTRALADEVSLGVSEFLRTGLKDGVNAAAPDPGTGKSTCMRIHAIERARDGLWAKEVLTEAEISKRPPNVKTAIATDTNELAIEYYERIKRDAPDVPVKRLFSPPSLIRNGKKVCHFAESAGHIAGGGMSVRFEFCQGRNNPANACKYLDTCEAASGFEGAEDALIAVGSQSLISELSDFAGSTGVLAIDEMRSLVETVEITLEMAAVALAISGLDHRYEAAMRPAVSALVTVLKAGEFSKEMDTLRSIVRRGQGGVSVSDFYEACKHVDPDGAEDEDRTEAILDCAANALPEDARTNAPPFAAASFPAARVQPTLAKRMRDAAVVYGTVYAAVTSRGPGFWLEDRPGVGPVVIVNRVKEEMREAFNRPGRVVILDADVHLQIGVIKSLLTRPYDINMPTTPQAARDGCRVTRTHLRSGQANRSGWWKKGSAYPRWDDRVARSLSLVAKWIREDRGCKRVGLVTFAVIERAIGCIVGGMTEAGRAQWVGWGYVPEQLDAANEALGPVIASAGVEHWELGHYGAIRGVNRFMAQKITAMITLGDPRPNIDAVAREVERLGVKGAAAMEPEVRRERINEIAMKRANEIAQADLRQALARVRECRVTVPTRLLHVGDLVPGGEGWRISGLVDVRADEGSSVVMPGGLTGEAFSEIVVRSHLSKREIARRLGVSHTQIDRYLKGAPSPFTSESLLSLLPPKT